MNSESDVPAAEGDHADEPVTGEPLVGVQAWPGAESSYWLSGTEKQPTAAVSVWVQPDFGLPGPADSPQQAALLAAKQAEQYRLIRSQLDDPSLAVSLLTTLDPGLAMPAADGTTALRRFARAAELFAGAAAAAMAPKLTGITTLGELIDRYGLPAERLAAANADQALNGLLAAGQPLAMRIGQLEPDTVPTGPNTLAQVAAQLRITPRRLLDDNRGLRLATDSTFVLPGIVTLPADARTPYRVQPGDTLAVLARRFGTMARQLVADNAEVTGTLLAGVHIEISVEARADADADADPDAEASPEIAGESATVSTDTVAGDSFQSLRTRLAKQNARVTLDAVADALDRLGAVLAAGPVLSCPLALLGGGPDDNRATPLTATEVQTRHGCPPATFAAANAAVLGVLQPGIQLRVGASTVTTAESDTLNAVLGRLSPDGGTPAIAELLSNNATVPLFRAGGRALLPPPPVTVTAAPGTALNVAVAAVPLAVTLRLERAHAATPQSGAADPEAPAERADTTVSLLSRDRDTFVDACLTALPTVRLAIDDKDELWAVSFGSAGISSVRIEPSAGGDLGPRAFAVRALYQELVDFDASVRQVTAQGGLGTPTLRQFRHVDIEPWARAFVTDLDRCLAEPISSRLPEAVAQRLLQARGQVSEAIAGGLEQVLQIEEDDPAALGNARVALAALGRDGLAHAYLPSVVGQYRAVAVAPYGADGQPAARLVGTLQAPDRSDLSLSTSRTELSSSSASCTFALSSLDPAFTISASIQPRQVFDALELDSSDPGPPRTEPVLLRFVRPLEGNYRPETVLPDLPPAELPIPLREHPSPVWAQPMTAGASFAGPGRPTLAEAARWTSGLTYTHQHAAQDVVRLSMPQLRARVAAPATEAADTALAEALAGYTEASAALAELIGSDVEPSDDIDAATLRGNAAASLAELATAVATAWARHWPGPGAVSSGPAAAGLASGYRLRAVYASDTDTTSGARLLDRLVVSRTGAESGWPVINMVSGDQQLPLTPGPVTDQTREYATSERPAAAGPLTFRLDWPGLRGAPGPDARITVIAERNSVLRTGAVTSPALVLTGQPIQVEVASPSLRWSEELPLTGNDIGQALQNAFDVLSEGQPDSRFSIEVGYAEPVGELHTVLPVLLIPELALAPDSAATIATELNAWQHATKPATTGAEWQLRMALLSPRAGEPPLLTFDRLVFGVSADQPNGAEPSAS